jgi:hypothetical protein
MPVLETVRNISFLSKILQLYSEISEAVRNRTHVHIHFLFCFEWPILWPPRILTIPPGTPCIEMIGCTLCFPPKTKNSWIYMYSLSLIYEIQSVKYRYIIYHGRESVSYEARVSTPYMAFTYVCMDPPPLSTLQYANK